MRCIILSCPVVSRGRICVASASESRHDGYRSSGPQALIPAAILRAHFGRYFLTELAGLPIVTGQADSMARTEKPELETFASLSAAVLPKVKILEPRATYWIPSEFTIWH
jgi:hypothetical protein